MGVHQNAFWPQERWPNFPEDDGFDYGWTFICFRLRGYILVFSPDLQSHVEHLRSVLKICRIHGLTISLPKCEFLVSSLEFLGHTVSQQGIQPLEKHTAALQNFPPPTDMKGLQRFLGMINFYRRFIKDAALILAPLTNAQRVPKPQKSC